MQLATFSILLWIASVGTCWIQIITKSKHEEISSLSNAMVHIVKSCYANRVSEVGLAGDSPGILIKKLSYQTSLPVTLLENTARVVHNRPRERTSRYPLQVYVVSASFPTELKAILTEIKGSLWWNHMASVFIFSIPIGWQHGCANAFEMLEVAWTMDLLHAKLICYHPTRGRLIFSYNPYIGYAPIPWQLENTYRRNNRHPWTLFVQRYRDNEGVCEELDFDKTKDLGGYKMRSIVKSDSESWNVIPNKTGIDSFGGFSGVIAQILFRTLNATPNILMQDNLMGFLRGQKGIDIAEDVRDGKYDIGLNLRYLMTVDNATTTYPHFYADLGILTHYNGYETQLSKFQPIGDDKSEYGVYLVILMTVIYFKCFHERELSLAILNTLRIICTIALPKLPNNLIPRIFLASLFLFTITIQVFYQGKLAALLSTRVPLPDVNSVEDLMTSGHNVYCYKSYARFLNKPEFEGRVFQLQNFDCTTYVKRDAKNACIEGRRFLIDTAMKLDLHISKRVIEKLSCIYVIRPDWPLEQRINKILMALMEGDIIRHLTMKKYEKSALVFEFNDDLKNSEQFKVISLKELSFAFLILGVGLGCASVIFLLELAVYRARSKIVKIRGYIKALIQWQRSILFQ